MLEQPLRSIGIALIAGSVFLSSCSYMTRSGRQQMAYRNYVKKYSHNRVKQQTKFKKIKTPQPPQTQEAVRTASSSGPQSVSSAQPPPTSEPAPSE
jgi:hypothetical protein